MQDTVYIELRLNSWVVSVREMDAVRTTWFSQHAAAAAYCAQQRQRLDLPV
jgi:hypothetical protein